MSETYGTFGLLELPAPAPEEGTASTDPALDMILAFLKAVVNHDLGDAWAERAPADPNPVAHVFPHNPDPESFDTNRLPAIYLWRNDDAGGTHRYSQDLSFDEGGFIGLWVPPPASQENRADRQAFRNGLKKSMRRALAQGRHPAWVIPGDTYYEPEDYGSVLLYHAKLSKARLGQFKSHTLVLDFDDGSRQKPIVIDCIMFTIDALEFFESDGTDAAGAPVDGHAELDHVEGTASLPRREDQGDPLEVLMGANTVTMHFEVELVSIDPATGPAAGGTTVEITGKQFTDPELMDLEAGEAFLVYFGTATELAAGTGEQVDPRDVEFVDDTRISVVAPAHAAGVVDIQVVFASGITRTLSGVFTYT